MNTVKAKGVMSAVRSAHNQLWSSIATLWGSADTLTKMKWAQIGRQMGYDTTQMQVSGPVVSKSPKGGLTATSKAKPRRLTGYKACLSVVSLRAAVNPGIPLDITPPAAIVKPQGIPPVRLVVTEAAASQKEGENAAGPSVVISLASGGYSGAFQVFAAAAVLSPYDLPTDLPMTLIQMGDLQTGQCDLSASYLAHFDPPVVGTKVPLKLVPVSNDGFRGAPLEVIADVVAPAQLQKAA